MTHPRSTLPTARPFAAAGPAAGRPAPIRSRFPAAGPAAGLLELPDASGVTLTEPAEADALLRRIEAARQRQLDAMVASRRDPVSAAYRATVQRFLEETRAARRRVVAGTYGVCTGCRATMGAEWLVLRPWSATCAACEEP